MATKTISLAEDGVVTAVSAMELWEGIHLAASSESECRAVEDLLGGLHHAELDRPAAMRAGAMSAPLVVEGTSVEVEDVMVAANAAELGQPVLTRTVEDSVRFPDSAVGTY